MVERAEGAPEKGDLGPDSSVMHESQTRTGLAYPSFGKGKVLLVHRLQKILPQQRQ